MIVLDDEKQPWDRDLYKVDHAARLESGVTLVSATVFSIECLNVPADTALTYDALLIVASPLVQIWLNGGTAGCKYKVTVRAILSDTTQVESEIIIRVKNT